MILTCQKFCLPPSDSIVRLASVLLPLTLCCAVASAQSDSSVRRVWLDPNGGCELIHVGKDESANEALVKKLTAAGAVVLFIFESKDKPIVTLGSGLLAAAALLDLNGSEKKTEQTLQICPANDLYSRKPVYYLGTPNLTAQLAARDSRADRSSAIQSHAIDTDSAALADATKQIDQLRLHLNTTQATQLTPSTTLSPAIVDRILSQRLTPPSENYASDTVLQLLQNASSASLSGAVRYGDRAVQGAIVRLLWSGSSASQLVVTDASGGYSFSSLQPGSYTLDVGKNGFTETTQTVTLESGSAETANVQLSSDVYPCTFTIINRTPWLIEVNLIDGSANIPMPNLRPYQSLPLPGVPHQQQFVALANFRDHAALNWGPINVTCSEQTSASLLPPS